MAKTWATDSNIALVFAILATMLVEGFCDIGSGIKAFYIRFVLFGVFYGNTMLLLRLFGRRKTNENNGD